MLWEDKNYIPDHIWKELNHKYRVDVMIDSSGCTKYRVFNKLTQQAELETYVHNDGIAFYRQKAKEIEEEFERIILSE